MNKLNYIHLGNGLVLLPSVHSVGEEWHTGCTTWLLWPDAVVQERVCLGVAKKGRQAFGYFARMSSARSQAKGDQEVVCWPLSKLVFPNASVSQGKKKNLGEVILHG